MGLLFLRKVYRYRKRDKGSKFNDGLIGLKKLAPIPQETIVAWNFKTDGKDLDGLYQSPAVVSNRNEWSVNTDVEPKFIPRKKFLWLRIILIRITQKVLVL